MATYRNFYTNYWEDSDILELTADETYIYLYLITNPRGTACGIYEMPLKMAEIHTKRTKELILKVIETLVAKGKIAYDPKTNEICIRNWIRHNYNSSPNTSKAFQKSLEDVKNKNLILLLSGIEDVAAEYVEEIKPLPSHSGEASEPLISVSVCDSILDTNIKEQKKRYGDFQHVLLTDKQYAKLHVDYPNADELIKYLDEHIQMKNYKAADHNLAIRKWVVNAVREEKLRNAKSGTNPKPIKGTKYGDT